MRSREKLELAQNFLVIRIDSPVLSSEAAEFISKFRPLGYHFGKNAFRAELSYQDWLRCFCDLKTEIQQLSRREKCIWALDHEGGRVHRLPEPFTHFVYPLNWREESGSVGKVIGRELRSLGINVLFGPCLDTYVNKDNRVIGPRSFGRSPDEVESFALSYIEELTSQGLVATGKHFPGHGSTKEDSHFMLPISELSMEELKEGELRPFKKAIERGMQAIMNAHIVFQRIDSGSPASLSPSFGKTLLRDELRFEGVSFTDDLDMKAISKSYDAEQIAEGLIASETNFAIFNHSFDHAEQVFDALVAAVDPSDERVVRISERSTHFLDLIQHSEPFSLSTAELSSHRRLADGLEEQFDIEVKEFTGD
jgi:beta-N-acetylhexosaminidase